MSNTTHWIAIDWGTTHLRVYALDKDNKILAETYSTKGMGTLKQTEFEPALLELVTAWLPKTGVVQVLACGMVGARQGWVEAPYQSVPCPPFGQGSAVPVMTDDIRLDVYILPGVRLDSPADVMRGEETQIAGFIRTFEGQNATLCLPGTHSKWVTLENGQIVDFSTFMTGEMFNLFSDHSILRYSVDTSEWDDEAFSHGVDESLRNPNNWLNSFFRLRAKGILSNMEPPAARSYLSGLLIGAELAGAKKYWSDQTVALIGDLKLSQLYAVALTLIDVDSIVLDPKELTLAGLCDAYKSLNNRRGIE